MRWIDESLQVNHIGHQHQVRWFDFSRRWMVRATIAAANMPYRWHIIVAVALILRLERCVRTEKVTVAAAVGAVAIPARTAAMIIIITIVGATAVDAADVVATAAWVSQLWLWFRFDVAQIDIDPIDLLKYTFRVGRFGIGTTVGHR